MSKIYFTLTGTKHYYGQDFLKKGMKIYLEKERDNEYDKEAIKVTCEGLGKIGYIANSSYTVIGDSMSAGRIYDKIGDTAKAKVELVTDYGIICRLCKKSLLESEQNSKKQYGIFSGHFTRKNTISSSYLWYTKNVTGKKKAIIYY